MDKYTIEHLVLVFLFTVHLAVLVLFGIADHLSALPCQYNTQLWSPIVTLHQTFHLGLGQTIGPSGVRALPLAAGINVGGHYKWHFFLSSSSLSLSFFLSSGPLLILPEGVVIGIQICMGS